MPEPIDGQDTPKDLAIFKPRRLADYSNESLITEIRRVAALLPSDHPIAIEEFSKYSMVHAATIQRRFGGWDAALHAAGCGHRVDTSNRFITKDEVISEMRRVAALLGTNSLTWTEFGQHAKYAVSLPNRRFGSWFAALENAGLAQREKVAHNKHTEEECFENLLQVWTYHGQATYQREMLKPPSTIGGKAYIRFWGTWNKAIHAFAQRVNADLEPSHSLDQQLTNPTTISAVSLKTKSFYPIKTTVPVSQLRHTPPKSRAEKRDISLGLRYTILKRDQFKCVICGATPARDPMCQLHVDHIHPLSKGGKTLIENLRTTCQACNLGKGAKLE